MSKIPTAKEVLDILIPFKENVSKEENEDSLQQNVELLIGWCKLHCVEQAKVISEKVKINDITEQQSYYLEDYFNGINKDSILNAYNLNLII